MQRMCRQVLRDPCQKAYQLIREPYVVKKQYNLIQIPISFQTTPYKHTHIQPIKSLLSHYSSDLLYGLAASYKSIKIFQFGSQLRQGIFALIIIQRMLQETPSIQFQLEDYNQVAQATINQVVLQFSNTIRKDQNIQCKDTNEIKKILNFQNTTHTHIQPQIFYEQFQNNFIVQFDSQEQQIIQKTSIYPLSQPNAFGYKNENIKFSHFNLSHTIQFALQDKEIKSQIITKKGFPKFQIRNRKPIKNKLANKDNNLPPNTCRNLPSRGKMFFTSKATPQDSIIAKEMHQKYDKEYARKQNKSLFQLNDKIKQFWASKNPEKIIDNLSSEIRNRRKQRKRVNIFEKLPLIK